MSGKLSIPKKNSLTGLKIFCMSCKANNPKCKHFDKHRYRMHVHVKGGGKARVSKVLEATEYSKAFLEAVQFKTQMEASNFERVESLPRKSNYALTDAIMKYFQYMDGKHHYRHRQKTVAKAHRDECIRYCRFFAKVVAETKDITQMNVRDTTQEDVSNYYTWAEKKYNGLTFNKAMARVKSFYDFLIDVEGIKMENPFKVYESKPVQQNKIQALTRQEFEAILAAIDTHTPWRIDSKGGKKRMDWAQLDKAFKLFLLTGGRREEVLTLRWSQIRMTIDGVRYFEVANLKVLRQNLSKSKREPKPKIVAINSDLMDVLNELGYQEKRNTDDYIIYADETATRKTIMDRVSKSFTHYRQGAGIGKVLSLKDLRKTYLTWLNVIMQKQTGLLSSHTSYEILERHYLDPTVFDATTKAALNLKVFGASK